jgi:LacI family transcriptional regulator
METKRRRGSLTRGKTLHIALLCGREPGAWLRILHTVDGAVRRIRETRPCRAFAIPYSDADFRDMKIVADGILFSAGPPRDAEAVLALGPPAVDIGRHGPAAKWPAPAIDERAIGRMAARHLLERGYKRFAAIELSGTWRTASQIEAFGEELRRAGASVDVHTSLDNTKDAIERSIRADVRPLGVFAANDDWAEWIVSAMIERGLSVPRQLGVVGVGDSQVAGLRSLMPISSVQLPAAAIGEAAADILLALIEKRKPPEMAPLQPVRVIPRESTGYACASDPLVAAAMAYMANHLRDPGERSLAAALNVSARLVRKRFAATLGRGPRDLWRQLRMENAQDILLRTNRNVGDIAMLCGYGGDRQFIRAFKEAVGDTPDRWRRSVRVAAR